MDLCMSHILNKTNINLKIQIIYINKISIKINSSNNNMVNTSISSNTLYLLLVHYQNSKLFKLKIKINFHNNSHIKWVFHNISSNNYKVNINKKCNSNNLMLIVKNLIKIYLASKESKIYAEKCVEIETYWMIRSVIYSPLWSNKWWRMSWTKAVCTPSIAIQTHLRKKMSLLLSVSCSQIYLENTKHKMSNFLLTNKLILITQWQTSLDQVILPLSKLVLALLNKQELVLVLEVRFPPSITKASYSVSVKNKTNKWQ